MCAASLPSNLISKVIISDNCYSLKMNQEYKEYLLAHMQLKLEREPNMKPSGMKSWLLAGEQKFDLTQVKPKILFKFIQRSKDKFLQTSSVVKIRKGSNKILKQTAMKIKRLALKKQRRSTRKEGAMMGVSAMTVSNTLKKFGARPYHKRKVQGMSDDHKQRRVNFAKWARNEYGVRVNGNNTWGRLVNTDFSAMVKKLGSLNTKNDVILSRSREEV